MITKHTPGRYLQSLAIAKGNHHGAVGFAESQGHWTDRSQVVTALKAVVTPLSTGDFPGALVPIADAFLAAMRPLSIPLQLAELRRTPMFTRLYVSGTGVFAAEVAEGAAIPVLGGSWSVATLTPRKFAGIVVQTNELMRSTSAVAAAGIVDDLAAATAEAENFAFVSADTVGSVLYGAPNFPSTGGSLAQIDADLRTLLNLVAGAAAWVMTRETATFLSLVRGTGGAPAYPNITPRGGFLLGLPVFVTTAAQEVGSPPTRIVGVLSPREIFWADEGKVVLSTDDQGAMKMDNAPTNAPGNLVSMYQTESTATKAVRESAWYARPGAGAYFVAGY